jgi:DNA-binding FrmR family transcriptional regulator
VKQEELLTRIRRIRGQVEGIERMMVEQRSCLEIVQQVAAVKSALSKLGGTILAAESCRKLNKKNPQDFSKIINELVKNL